MDIHGFEDRALPAQTPVVSGMMRDRRLTGTCAF